MSSKRKKQDCPHDNLEGMVKDSRRRGDFIWRRRTCTLCGENYTTVEIPTSGKGLVHANLMDLADKLSNIPREERKALDLLIDSILELQVVRAKLCEFNCK